jgi:large subunit ribosomal protein L35Ae
MTKGKVIQFRRGRHIIHERHFLIEAEGIDSKEKAGKMIGKSVEWKSPAGKAIKGKIAAAHGNKGVLRAIFEKGLPGQALTTEVKIE